MKNLLLAFFTSRFLQRVLLLASVGFLSTCYAFAAATPPDRATTPYF